MKNNRKIYAQVFSFFIIVATFALASRLTTSVIYAQTPIVPLTNTGSTVPPGTYVNPQTGQYTSDPAAQYATTPASGLVVCTGAKDPSNPSDNRPVCDFNYLLVEGKYIINWLFVIAIPIAIVLFSYGGVLYIIGTPGNRKKAKEIFTAAGIGFGIMLIAWVSVYTIVSWLTTGSNTSSNNSSGITTFLGK